MNGDTILENVIIGTIMLIIGGVGGWISGKLKGKKESSTAIERKDEIYQPLLDDTKKYSQFNWAITETVKIQLLGNVVNESYKYCLPEEIQEVCNTLYNSVVEYNGINTIIVAKKIIVSLFKRAYKDIYGSTIDGVIHHSDQDGNEYDEEVDAKPIEVIEQMNFTKEIENLLYNEGMYSDEVCIDEDNNVNIPIYLQLKRIYELSLNASGYVAPKAVIEMKMKPEEYIASYYDFFEQYNNCKEIKRKEELREEIILSCQLLVEELKEIINKIVKIYEVEKI